MGLIRKIAVATVALAAVCLYGSSVAGAVALQHTGTVPKVHSAANRSCPARGDIDAALGSASTFMEEGRYQDAAAALKPLSALNCDARASLLLAAAFEAEGNVPAAEQTLQQAHSLWPSNNSISASLAREYLGSKQLDKAVETLDHFHLTPTTPEQEMELAVVVYLAAHRLIAAQAVAEANYKAYPSLHALLLLANALQLEGRYPDVNRLLGEKKAIYADSPEFLITLAESESDAAIYPAARTDLERAIALDPKSHQAHYLLGYVLARLNDADKAIEEYRAAIDLDPDQPRAYFQLALALRTKQDEAGEEHALEQALAIDDRYAPAHCEMGRILIEQHRLADAVPHLTSAVRYNPKSEEAYFLLAKTYKELGETDKSQQMVKLLETVRKENRPAASNMNKTQPARMQGPNP